jgi:hypothetical protein
MFSSDKKDWTQKLEETGLSHNQAATIADIIYSAVEDLETDVEADTLRSDLDDVKDELDELKAEFQPVDPSPTTEEAKDGE